MSRRTPTPTDPRRKHNRDGNAVNQTRRHFPPILQRQRLRHSPIAAECDAELALISEHNRSETDLSSLLA